VRRRTNILRVVTVAYPLDDEEGVLQSVVGVAITQKVGLFPFPKKIGGNAATRAIDCSHQTQRERAREHH
jgi:hypothetical protein